jgi:ATP adenylyltransferase/5',5'''-P-1,P-4-tetraphosphate phosphorylase II
MPIYTFRNKETQEEFDLEMKMSEREDYLAANPTYEQIFNKFNVGDSVRLGITKPPSDFTKYVFG